MKNREKPRVVLDTNLIVSACIIANSVPDKLLQKWNDDEYDLLMSHELLQEIIEVSQRPVLQKYHRITKNIPELIEAFKLTALIVQPTVWEKLPVHCRDPKDDILLAAAWGGNADYLITGDRDLLVLDKNPFLGTLKIIGAKIFLDILS